MGKNRRNSSESSTPQPTPTPSDIEPETLDDHISSWVHYPGGSIDEKLTDEEMMYVKTHMTNEHQSLTRIERRDDTFERVTEEMDWDTREARKMPPLQVGDTFKFTKKGGYTDNPIRSKLTAFSSTFQATKEIAEGYIWPGEGNKWVVFRINENPPNFDIDKRGHHGYAQKEEKEVWVNTDDNEFVVDKITENVNIKSNPEHLDTFVTLVDVHMKQK